MLPYSFTMKWIHDGLRALHHTVGVSEFVEDREIQPDPNRKWISWRIEELQLSEAGTSSRASTADPTPVSKMHVKKEAQEEEQTSTRARTLQVDKPHTYVPVSLKKDTFVMQIEEKDIQEQGDYRSTALISCVLRDTPYLKSMESLKTSSFIPRWWLFCIQICKPIE